MRKTQALELIEMHDLLPDNVALAECLEALLSHNSSWVAEAQEVRALSTWVVAFATYVAVVAEAHPGCVRDMLAYMRVLV